MGRLEDPRCSPACINNYSVSQSEVHTSEVNGLQCTCYLSKNRKHDAPLLMRTNSLGG